MNAELISVNGLKKKIPGEKLVIIDASPEDTKSGVVSDFRDLFIPNARRFDIKSSFTDTTSDFPNTLPSASQFQEECQTLGIHSDSEIVVYDNLGIYTSPRVWWMFKVMGHDNVKVLNGGLPEWISKGFETVDYSDLNQEHHRGDFKAQLQSEYILSYEDIKSNIASKKFTIVDARSAGRFMGKVLEPREHLQSGSIPHSVNIPYSNVLEHGKFKSSEEIKAIFRNTVEHDKQLVFSCGSGMTACIVLLASEIAFKSSRYLYDGSWTEYATLSGLMKK